MNPHIAGLLGLLLAAGSVTGVAAEQPRRSADAPASAFSQRVLAEHNRERDRAGVPRLAWNAGLARDAQAWAHKLAAEGWLRHASRAENGGTGENLWMGSAGFYAPETMVGAFLEEGLDYRPGTFPNVSRTGNWQDVGHYTQIVWRDTREVGCAIASNARDDFLVCRYWPSGNWMGQRPF
jgi:uncharacterized protein YkwD